MIADMVNNNKKLNPIVTSLFIRRRKLNIYITFITQSYFKVPKDVILNSVNFFIMKIPNKREIQQILIHFWLDIDFKDFAQIYKKCTTEPYSFLANDTTLPSDNPLIFQKSHVINTTEKMKFSIKDFFSKWDQIYRFLWFLSHLLKKSLMENSIFCAVKYIIKVMTVNGQIWDWKLQDKINREPTKISVLSSGKIGKCEYLTGAEILTSDQKPIK